MFIYKTSGVCSTEIQLDIKDDTIENVTFIRGCSGNLTGISTLLKGMKVDDAISKLSGINCGPRPTSCPDQLAKALIQYKAQ